MRVSSGGNWRAAAVMTVCLSYGSAALAAPEPAAQNPTEQATASQQPTAAAPPALGAPAPSLVIPAWPPALPDQLPPRDPARGSVDRAWRLGTQAPEAKVSRTQRVGLDLGLRSLEGPAWGLLNAAEEEGELERAEAAVELAPALPAAHGALAAAQLAAGDSRAALSAVIAGLGAIPGHLEARAWTDAAAFGAAARASFLWALAFCLIGAIASLPHLRMASGPHASPGAGPFRSPPSARSCSHWDGWRVPSAP